MAVRVSLLATRARAWLTAHGGAVVVVAAALIVTVWPLVMLCVAVVQQGPAVLQALTARDSLAPLANSVVSSTVATLLGLAIGAFCALVLAATSPGARRWWQVAVLFALFIPPFVGAFSWLQAYARTGLTDQLWHVSFGWLYGSAGVTVLLAVHSAPLAYVIIAAALTRTDQRAVEAARIHGASAWQAFTLVTWPVLRPTLVAAAGLMFALNIGDFGIPLVLGLPGHFVTATTQIYEELSFVEGPQSFAVALGLSLILAVGSLLILLALQRTDAEHAIVAYAEEAGARPRAISSWKVRLGLVAIGAYIVFSAGLPFVALLLAALTRAYGLPPVPANWTLRHFANVFQGDIATAISHSVMLAGVAATVVLLLGILAGEWARHSRFGQIIERVSWLPYAIPGSVMGVAAIVGFSRWFYGTFAIILLAYIGKFWGLTDPLVTMRRQVNEHRVQAGRIFGARPLRAYFVGIWPLLSGTALAIWVLVFVDAVYELTMSSLLYGPGTETVAVVVLNAEQEGDVATTAVIAVLMSLVMLVSLVLVTLAGARQQTRQLAPADEFAEEAA